MYKTLYTHRILFCELQKMNESVKIIEEAKFLSLKLKDVKNEVEKMTSRIETGGSKEKIPDVSDCVNNDDDGRTGASHVLTSSPTQPPKVCGMRRSKKLKRALVKRRSTGVKQREIRATNKAISDVLSRTSAFCKRASSILEKNIEDVAQLHRAVLSRRVHNMQVTAHVLSLPPAFDGNRSASGVVAGTTTGGDEIDGQALVGEDIDKLRQRPVYYQLNSIIM